VSREVKPLERPEKSVCDGQLSQPHMATNIDCTETPFERVMRPFELAKGSPKQSLDSKDAQIERVLLLHHGPVLIHQFESAKC